MDSTTDESTTEYSKTMHTISRNQRGPAAVCSRAIDKKVNEIRDNYRKNYLKLMVQISDNIDTSRLLEDISYQPLREVNRKIAFLQFAGYKLEECAVSLEGIIDCLNKRREMKERTDEVTEHLNSAITDMKYLMDTSERGQEDRQKDLIDRIIYALTKKDSNKQKNLYLIDEKDFKGYLKRQLGKKGKPGRTQKRIKRIEGNLRAALDLFDNDDVKKRLSGLLLIVPSEDGTEGNEEKEKGALGYLLQGYNELREALENMNLKVARTNLTVYQTLETLEERGESIYETLKKRKDGNMLLDRALVVKVLTAISVFVGKRCVIPVCPLGHIYDEMRERQPKKERNDDKDNILFLDEFIEDEDDDKNGADDWELRPPPIRWIWGKITDQLKLRIIKFLKSQGGDTAYKQMLFINDLLRADGYNSKIICENDIKDWYKDDNDDCWVSYIVLYLLCKKCIEEGDEYLSEELLEGGVYNSKISTKEKTIGLVKIVAFLYYSPIALTITEIAKYTNVKYKKVHGLLTREPYYAVYLIRSREEYSKKQFFSIYTIKNKQDRLTRRRNQLKERIKSKGQINVKEINKIKLKERSYYR